MNICIMGMPKSGKTSIAKVVFQKMSPHETFFLTQTNSIEMQPVQNNDNIQFNVVDFPANVQFKADVAQHISQCGALIYVIDA